jgi:hypothetical protein
VTQPQLPVDPQFALQNAIAASARSGWRLEGAYGNTATMASGQPANHVLHLILTLVSCGLWAPVWLFVAATSGVRRLVITVDPAGQISYQRSA